MSEGPSGGAILLAIFLILFGLCFTLLGGGCTIFWIWAMFQGGGSYMEGSAGFMMIGLVTLAVGVLLLWVSVKLLRGNTPGAPPAPQRQPDPTPPPPDAEP